MNAMKLEVAGEPLGTGEMFDRIAPRYDLLNRVMSLGVDKLWRRKLVNTLGPIGEKDSLLDVATGTGDVALALARAYPGARVVGLDPSAEMIRLGRKKVAKRSLSHRVDLVLGDGQSLPFENDSYAGACIAFGIRNVPDRGQCLREMVRVTKPGKKVVVLELNEPRGGPFSYLARFYVRHILPRVGGLLSGSKEYRYLQSSLATFPSAQAFEKLMRDCGLVDVVSARLPTGSAHLFHGTVP